MKITTKHASTGNSHFTFVTRKRFAVLLFLPSCCVNSLVLDDNETNDNGYGKENGKKRTQLSTKQQLRTYITLFVQLLSVVIAVVASLRLVCDLKLPYFMRQLYGVREHSTKKIFFLFRNSDTDLSDSTPDNFAKSLQINWN